MSQTPDFTSGIPSWHWNEDRKSKLEFHYYFACLAAFYLPLVQKTLIRLGKKGINLLTTKEVPTKYQVIIDSSGESGDLELIGYGLKSVKKITLSTNTTPIWDLMRPLVSKNLMALKGHENVTKITSYESHENATNWHWDFGHTVS